MASVPIACTLSASEQAERQLVLQREIGSAVEERVEIEGGFALRFPPKSHWIGKLAELVSFERECCPFLTLEISAQPNRGAVWLRMIGPDGTKPFLERSFAGCERT
jgi:hypothetical protein